MRKLTFLLFFIIFFISPNMVIHASETVYLEVLTEFEGVKVFVNDEFKGTTNDEFGKIRLSIPVEPGSYELRCQYEGYNDYVQSVQVLKSKVVEISFKDSQIQARSDYNADKGVTTSTTGTIILESRPLGATSKIIGRQEKSKPTNATYTFVPLGTYVTEFYFNRNKSDEFLSTEINLKEGDTIRLLADFYDGKIINKTEYRVTFISAEDELGILTIDDQKYGKLPNEIFLPVGNHHIVYEPSILKYGTFDQVVHIEESQLYKINLKVERFAVTFLLPEDAQGELYSDGNLLVGSLSGKKTVWMKPGSHKIEFISSNQRYKTFSSVMNISPEDQIWLPLERDKYLITIYNQTPFSGKISVNGVSQGILQQNKSVSMYTSLGKHTITLNHDNAEYEPIKKDISVEKDETFYLKDVKKASYPISITTYPESTRVSIGGTPIGKTPINTRLDYGTYTLSFELDGYKKISTEVNIHREMHIDQSLELIGSSITLLHDGNYMPYNTLSIGYGHTIKEGQKKEQIPPGRQLVRIGPESFFFEFENGHVYTIHPQFIIPDEPQYTIENMPNRMNRPPIPTLFDETKEIYRPDPLVLRYSIPFGAIIGGVLIGSIADSGAGLAIGGALGALGGYVFCYLSEVGNGKELVRTDPHLTAINENKNQMVLYGQKVAEIEKYNNAQLEILNSDVDKKNEQLKQHNASRDIIIIKNLTTEEKWGYNISGYNNEVYKIEAK